MSAQPALDIQKVSETLTVPDPGVDFAAQERVVQQHWVDKDVFKRSLEQSKDKPLFGFYDGPPFATGTPHYGHILAGTIKDTVTRFAHGKGYHVPRVFGWDCHGLPVENIIDKEKKLTSRQAILEFEENGQKGIYAYNEACRSIVMRCVDDWKKVVNRVGRFIDFDNSYKTMDVSFMESVWWVFKQLFDKGMVYRGYKVMPYSTALTSVLANFEASQNYHMCKDPSVVVTCPIVGDADGAALLAWTTTPWTLPSNLALCVNATLTYSKIKLVDRSANTTNVYICLESRIEFLFPKDKKVKTEDGKDVPRYNITVLSTCPGKDLVGLKYEPFFPYFVEAWKDRAFRVVSDDYVTAAAGTGVVHTSPFFGEDDNRVSAKWGIIRKGGEILCPVDADGRFTAEVVDFAGQLVTERPDDGHNGDISQKPWFVPKGTKTTNQKIIDYLKQKGRFVEQKDFSHNYPFCWRSDSPLIYRAVPSWFVRLEEPKDANGDEILPPDGQKTFKQRLLDNNEKTRWVPDNVKSARFANWLENARDWAISRSRYWGTPIPLWCSEDFSQIVAVGSVEELRKLSGQEDIPDIHTHKIAHITIPDPRGDEYPRLQRISEVFDCWFESGSMPVSQIHYPFENQDRFKNCFPADFIAEGLDQTRGWFYTLLVLSTALFDTAPFKNVIVNGLVLAGDGHKMSKSLKNYTDPLEIIEKEGADALRMYLLNSPVVRAEPLLFKDQGVNDVKQRVLKPWWNAFIFALENVDRYNASFGEKFVYNPQVLQDIVSRPSLIDLVTQNPDFDTSTVEQSTLANVTDKWILSVQQTLIKFVHAEVDSYRLYTILPQLLSFIDNLTNMYVRTNRRRMKQGSAIFDDTALLKKDRYESLTVLISVLFSLCRLMAPFTPFFVEAMYQYLQPILPEEFKGDSVHFLMLPTFDEKQQNVVIESVLSQFQTVLELGRSIRLTKKIGMKKPLSRMILACNDSLLLSQLKTLEPYCLEELNMKALETSQNPKQYVSQLVQPDAKIIAKRAGKLYRDVAKTLEAFTEEQIDEFKANGKTTVLGIEVAIEEVEIILKQRTDSASSGDLGLLCSPRCVVIVDCTPSRSLTIEGYARELISTIQQLRKSSGLIPRDRIRIFYQVVSEQAPADGILVSDVAKECSALIESVLFKPAEPMEEFNQNPELTSSVCGTVSVVINEQNVKFVIAKL
jgi:isoleucyl-tRNA synthetase